MYIINEIMTKSQVTFYVLLHIDVPVLAVQTLGVVKITCQERWMIEPDSERERESQGTPCYQHDDDDDDDDDYHNFFYCFFTNIQG